MLMTKEIVIKIKMLILFKIQMYIHMYIHRASAECPKYTFMP